MSLSLMMVIFVVEEHVDDETDGDGSHNRGRERDKSEYSSSTFCFHCHSHLVMLWWQFLLLEIWSLGEFKEQEHLIVTTITMAVKTKCAGVHR